jgi:predicted TIM-barrel fold metal-dependent hydrolase
MVIDLHTHVGPGLAQHENMTTPITSETGADLVRLLDESRVDKAVVFPPLWEGGDFLDPNYETGNEAVRKAAAEFPDRLIGFVRVNPNLGQRARDEVQRNLESRAMGGIMLHPDWECFYPDDPTVHRLLELADRFGVVVAFHSGESDYYAMSGPALFLQLARRFPRVNIVLKHMGYRLAEDAIQVALERPNIYLETAGAFSSNIRKAITRVGADRVVFGSDAPYHHPKIEAKKITELPTVSAADKRKVMGENLARLLKLA